MAVFSPIELLKLSFDLAKGNVETQFFYPGGAQDPIVIESRTIFPGVELTQGDWFLGKKSYGFDRGAMKRFAGVNQDAVYVEYDDSGISGFRSRAGTSGFLCSFAAAITRIRNWSCPILRLSDPRANVWMNPARFPSRLRFLFQSSASRMTSPRQKRARGVQRQ